MHPFVRTVAITALALATVLAGRAGAQDCETGGARVTFDSPTLNLVFSPDDAPIQVTARAGGFVKVRTPPAPTTFVVNATGLQRSAVAARFVFDRNVNATLVVRRVSGGSGSGSWFSIERATTTCAFPITTENVNDVGTHEVSVPDVNEHPFMLGPPFALGESTFLVTAPFKKGVVYRLVFYVQSGSLNGNFTDTWQAFGDTEPDPEPDPALKLIPRGADPLTGCPGTDASNLEDAVLALKKAQFHASFREMHFDTSDPVRTAPSKQDDQQVKALIELGRQHLLCARTLVQGRVDLSQQVKDQILAEIDQSLAGCDASDAALDAPNPSIRNENVLAASQLRNCSTQLLLAISDARAAGSTLPEFSEPDLPVGYGPTDDPNAVADVMQDALDLADQEAENLKARFEAIRDRVRDGGDAALRQVLASNADPACLEFLRAKLLGELANIAMIADRRKLDQALAADQAVALAEAERLAEKERKQLAATLTKVAEPIVEEETDPTPREERKVEKAVERGVSLGLRQKSLLEVQLGLVRKQ